MTSQYRTTPSGKVTKVGSYTLPPNTTIATSLFAIHNTKHNWDEPLAYRPDRWQDVPVEQFVADCRGSSSNAQEGVDGEDTEWEPSKQRASTKAITFMPFSEGPRNCVGQSLAKMEVLTLLATLLSQFRLELAPEVRLQAHHALLACCDSNVCPVSQLSGCTHVVRCIAQQVVM